MVEDHHEKSNARPPDLLDAIREAVRDELRAARKRETAPEPLLTKEDAADILSVSPRTIDTLLASGEIASLNHHRLKVGYLFSVVGKLFALDPGDG